LELPRYQCVLVGHTLISPLLPCPVSDLGAVQSVSGVASGSDTAGSHLQTKFANAQRFFDEPSDASLNNKGKGREREPEISRSVTPIYDTGVTGRGADSFASDSHRSLNIDSEYLAETSESERHSSSAFPHHAADAESLADRYGHETRRLQILEAQDEKSRELALRLDREERERAARKHAFEPPPLFPHGNKASSSLPSVSTTASALAGFVGNKLSPFVRPSTEKKPSNLAHQPSSVSTTKPVAQSNSDFMVALRQQMKEDEEARSAELARRLQREEETAVLRESSSWPSSRLD
jgi:hypothetical protein